MKTILNKSDRSIIFSRENYLILKFHIGKVLYMPSTRLFKKLNTYINLSNTTLPEIIELPGTIAIPEVIGLPDTIGLYDTVGLSVGPSVPGSVRARLTLPDPT